MCVRDPLGIYFEAAVIEMGIESPDDIGNFIAEVDFYCSEIGTVLDVPVRLGTGLPVLGLILIDIVTIIIMAPGFFLCINL